MKLMTVTAGIRDWLVKKMQADLTKLPKHISDQQARDIGMSRAELEWHRFTWPSNSEDRPLL